MYAYWELADGAPPAAGARAVLRFHESAATVNSSRPFDVEVDLAAGNWYVHLWSPGKFYQADLGLRGEDGAFHRLAQSNTVRTAPSAPVPSVPAFRPSGARPEPDPQQFEPVQTEPPASEPSPAEEPRETEVFFRRKLDQLFAIPDELPAVPESYRGTAFSLSVPEPQTAKGSQAPVAGPASAPPSPLPFHLEYLERMDLTEYSEERFTPGISSEGGPLDQ